MKNILIIIYKIIFISVYTSALLQTHTFALISLRYSVVSVSLASVVGDARAHSRRPCVILRSAKMVR